MSRSYDGANPWPGNWYTYFIPAHLMHPSGSGTPDPTPPGPWQNYWNPNFDSRGYVFDHPLGVNPDPATIHYDVLLPPYIKYWKTGTPLDIRFSLNYWTSGDITGADRVAGYVGIAGYPDLQTLGMVAPGRFPFLCGPNLANRMIILPWLSAWDGVGVYLPESSALHITVQRVLNNGIGVDTYAYEWFLYGITMMFRCN